MQPSTSARIAQGQRTALQLMLNILDLQPPFSLTALLAALERFRRRPIVLHATLDLPLPSLSVTVCGTRRDVIAYRAGLSAAHTEQVICHELIHVLEGHTASAADAVAGGRSTFGDHRELTAEIGGTLLASHLDSTRTRWQQYRPEDAELLRPLHGWLHQLAPDVYLDQPEVLDTDHEPGILLDRMITELTDARLALYYRTQTDELVICGAWTTPGQATLRRVARWEAQVLQAQRTNSVSCTLPNGLLTASFQTIAYYRVLATQLRQLLDGPTIAPSPCAVPDGSAQPSSPA